MTLQDATFSDTSEIEKLYRFGLNSPIPMIVIGAIYLLIVLKIGPSYMKSRSPYQLKTYIVLYNVSQIFMCIYLVYKMLIINLPTLEFWKCVPFTGTSVEKEFNYISMLTFWLKVSELTETVVFVLRKKERQISFLHVFHHSCTLFLAYHFANSYKASTSLFPLLINCNVHIVMYLYYLMAAVFPDDIVVKLIPLKKAITSLQLIQFVLLLIQVPAAISYGCTFPKGMLSVYIAIVCAFLYMFYDFYNKNYKAKGK